MRLLSLHSTLLIVRDDQVVIFVVNDALRLFAFLFLHSLYAAGLQPCAEVSYFLNFLGHAQLLHLVFEAGAEHLSCVIAWARRVQRSLHKRVEVVAAAWLARFSIEIKLAER